MSDLQSLLATFDEHCAKVRTLVQTVDANDTTSALALPLIYKERKKIIDTMDELFFAVKQRQQFRRESK